MQWKFKYAPQNSENHTVYTTTRSTRQDKSGDGGKKRSYRQRQSEKKSNNPQEDVHNFYECRKIDKTTLKNISNRERIILRIPFFPV